MKTQDTYLNAREVAKCVGCSVSTVWRWTADGILPKPLRLGNSTRWSANELFHHLDCIKRFGHGPGDIPF